MEIIKLILNSDCRIKGREKSEYRKDTEELRKTFRRGQVTSVVVLQSGKRCRLQERSGA